MRPNIVDEINSMRREIRALKTGGNIGFGQLGYQFVPYPLLVPASSTVKFTFACTGMQENVLPFAELLVDPSMFSSTLNVVSLLRSQSTELPGTLLLTIALGNNTNSAVSTTVNVVALGCSSITLQ